MAKVSTLYRPGYGPDDHDDENAFGVPPDGVVLGHDYGSPGNDRELDEYVSRQAGRSPDLKSVTTPDALAAGEPNDAEPDADSDDLKAYIERNAADKANKPVAYNPDQAHDSETWAMADAAPQAQAPIDTSPSALTKGAIVASGIGSFLQRKPFDQQFWGGREAHREKLARQGLVDQQAADRAALARQTLGLRGQELAQHAEGLKARIADNGEQREVQRARLGLEGDRTASTRALSDAKAADLNRKGALAAENADANGDRAHRMTEFYVRNGIPLRSVQGLSPDDMKQLSPELEKAFNLAEPQVRAEVGLASRKAGAESDARFPNEEKLARVRGEIQDTNAAAKTDRAGGGDQEADDVLVLHPHLAFIGDAGRRRYLAENSTRGGQSRISMDMDSSDRAHSASSDMSDLLEKITVGHWLEDPDKSFELQKQYDLYKNEHEGIIKQIARMKGGTSEERDEIKEELPKSLDYRAVPQMRGIESFLRNQSAALMQKHGLVTRGSRLYDEFQRSGKISQEAIDRETSDAPSAAPTAAAQHPQRASRRPAPPTPALAPDEKFAPMKIYNATSPSGKKAQRSYTDDEAAKLKAKGYRLEAVQ